MPILSLPERLGLPYYEVHPMGDGWGFNTPFGVFDGFPSKALAQRQCWETRDVDVAGDFDLFPDEEGGCE